LTDIGGVSFGIGLDDGDDGETDEVTLLEDKKYKFRWVQYMGPELAFDLMDKLIIEVDECHGKGTTDLKC